jgi:hypothetical protein
MSFITWLSRTAVSVWVRDQSPWLWPFCESLHFMGLVLVIGIAGAFDLRLMGFLRPIPVAALKRCLPWAIAGGVINLVTGLVFFVGSPYQYASNWAWWAKVTFLGAAAFNAVLFETRLSPSALTIGAGEDTPFELKAVGALSLFSWFAVLFFGRMLAFIGGTD